MVTDSTHSSKRARANLLVTEIRGRITMDMVVAMSRDYRLMMEPGSVWLVQGLRATSYASDAIGVARVEWCKLHEENELRVMVFVTKAPLVRMGITTTAAGMRAEGHPISLVVVESEEEANRALQVPRIVED